ncbi:hypothetical protein FH972_024246 [Carpinus fangiana]|uniref:Uncharacterized protein n=1 Tax=Carpinus fangiana TaxID=176857 RepID=A0A5N6L007_9ROSI|nr:hypothetical protein FH972_024246 [Carpinus fangiana]
MGQRECVCGARHRGQGPRGRQGVVRLCAVRAVGAARGAGGEAAAPGGCAACGCGVVGECGADAVGAVR